MKMLEASFHISCGAQRRTHDHNSAHPSPRPTRRAPPRRCAQELMKSEEADCCGDGAFEELDALISRTAVEQFQLRERQFVTKTSRQPVRLSTAGRDCRRARTIWAHRSIGPQRKASRYRTEPMIPVGPRTHNGGRDGRRSAPNCRFSCAVAVVPCPSSRRHRLGVVGRNCGLRCAWDAPSRGRSAVAPNSSLPSPPRKPRNWRRFAPGPVSAALRLNTELRSFRIRNRCCLLYFPKTPPSTTPNQPERQRIIFWEGNQLPALSGCSRQSSRLGKRLECS